MAVVPTDELGRADNAGQVLPGNAELAIMRRPRREDHCVIEVEQLDYRHVPTDTDIADKIDTRALRHFVVALADGLQRLVVGRHPEADQAVWDGVAIDDVDARLIAVGLLERFGCIEARPPRSDHRELPPAA